MVFLDSNIWCYYFNKSAEEHEDVVEKVDQIIESDQQIHVNTVVIMEVGHFLVKNLGGVKGREKLDKMLEYRFEITDVDYGLTTKSLEILTEEHQTGIGARDATIIAAMKEENIQTLVTHDQSFRSIDEIEVIDPVE